MTALIDTLGEALPREMARVRDEALPQYLAIGAPGAIAAALMRRDLDYAAQALAESDVMAMIVAYKELKGWTS